MSQNNKNKDIKKGFTILYAMLIAGVLLSIGASIASIAIREVALVSNAAQSASAFYIADSGVECALYMDFSSAQKVIASEMGTDPNPNMGQVFCGAYNTSIGNIMPVPSYTTNGVYRITKFTVYFDSDNASDPRVDQEGRCAVVTIMRSTINGSTIVDSRGFTTCNLTNPKVVERGIRVTY